MAAEAFEAQLHVHHGLGKDVGLDRSTGLELVRFVKGRLEID